MRIQNCMYLLLPILFFGISSCDKEDNGPSYTQADRDRCAHIDRYAELGEYLYDVCLRNPWPTDLPPATQSGQSTFGGIINDTLIFVAGSPRAFSYQTARANLSYLWGGGIDDHRVLYSKFGTYNEIDSSQIELRLGVLENGTIDPTLSRTLRRLLISNHDSSIDGGYVIDTNRYSIEIIRWDNDVVAGTIEAWFIHSDDSTRRIHLSEGRFDLTVRP